jgi:hypothetical protein
MSNFSLGMAAWKLSFQLSPIILNNGIAAQIPGGMLPIIAITEALNFATGILDGGDNIGLDSFFANFQVVPGDTMIDQTIGKYPFANQTIAANAVIQQPLKVSLAMICPVQHELGYATKLATMMALQAVLKQHNQTGGTYTILTPSVFYADCIMTTMSDITGGESKQVQTLWRLDFEQPLLTLTQAQQAYNSAMGKIGAGVQTDGSQTGLAQAINSPFTAQAPLVIPSASGAASSSTAVAPGGTQIQWNN